MDISNAYYAHSDANDMGERWGELKKYTLCMCEYDSIHVRMR